MRASRSALRAITRINVGWVDQNTSARRVLGFYNFFFRQRPVIMHLRVSERNQGDAHAQIAGAVRTLNDLGVRSVIDASPNALSVAVVSTERQVSPRLRRRWLCLLGVVVRSLPR